MVLAIQNVSTTLRENVECAKNIRFAPQAGRVAAVSVETD